MQFQTYKVLLNVKLINQNKDLKSCYFSMLIKHNYS